MPLKVNESAGRRPWEAQPVKTGVDQEEEFEEEVLSDKFETKKSPAPEIHKQPESSHKIKPVIKTVDQSHTPERKDHDSSKQ